MRCFVCCFEVQLVVVWSLEVANCHALFRREMGVEELGCVVDLFWAGRRDQGWFFGVVGFWAARLVAQPAYFGFHQGLGQNLGFCLLSFVGLNCLEHVFG